MWSGCTFPYLQQTYETYLTVWCRQMGVQITSVQVKRCWFALCWLILCSICLFDGWNQAWFGHCWCQPHYPYRFPPKEPAVSQLWFEPVAPKIPKFILHFTYCKHSFYGFLWTISGSTLSSLFATYFDQCYKSQNRDSRVCLLSFMVNNPVTSALDGCYTLQMNLWIIKELQTFTGLYVSVPCVDFSANTPSNYLTWLTYTLPLMHG